jgi:AcrR family transcriptional regulator
MAKNTLAKRRTISPDSARKKIKDKRRIQLLEANMDSIAKRGLAETTITHISQAAGMSRGIINFYFDSKEAMMLDTLRHILEEQARVWNDALERTSNDDPAKQLRAVINSIFNTGSCGKRILTVWAAFIAHAVTHAPYRHEMEQQTNALKGTLGRIWKQINTRDDEAMFANHVYALVRGFWIELMLNESGRPREDMAAEVWSFIEENMESKPALSLVTQARNLPQHRARPANTNRNDEGQLTADLFGVM